MRAILGEPYRPGTGGAPILQRAIASVECKVVQVGERGDQHIVIVQMIEADVSKPFDGRPDLALLHIADLGDKMFYVGLM